MLRLFSALPMLDQCAAFCFHHPSFSPPSFICGVGESWAVADFVLPTCLFRNTLAMTGKTRIFLSVRSANSLKRHVIGRKPGSQDSISVTLFSRLTSLLLSDFSFLPHHSLHTASLSTRLLYWKGKRGGPRAWLGNQTQVSLSKEVEDLHRGYWLKPACSGRLAAQEALQAFLLWQVWGSVLSGPGVGMCVMWLCMFWIWILFVFLWSARLNQTLHRSWT